VNNQVRNEQVLQYAPLVKYIVARIWRKLPDHVIDQEDLIQAGIIGLMSALEKFDGNRDVQFETFARFRIRGAVLDELRIRDWLPRSSRNKNQRLARAFEELQRELGRAPEDDEVAKHMGIPLEAYFKLLDDARGVSLVSREDLPPGYLENHAPSGVVRIVESGDPLAALLGAQTRERLKDAIDALPEKERLVLSLYYYEELTMKEIGKTLSLTESRVCQLHSKAVLHLRSVIREAF